MCTVQQKAYKKGGQFSAAEGWGNAQKRACATRPLKARGSLHLLAHVTDVATVIVDSCILQPPEALLLEVSLRNIQKRRVVVVLWRVSGGGELGRSYVYGLHL